MFPFLLVVALTVWLKLKEVKLAYLFGFVAIGLAIPFLVTQVLLIADVGGPSLNLFTVPVESLLVAVVAILLHKIGRTDIGAM